jgi:hypothetical protein
VDAGKNSVGRQKSKQSLAKGLRHLKLESPVHHHSHAARSGDVRTAYPPTGLSPIVNSKIPGRSSSGDSVNSVDSSWDVVDDLSLRWATDFVPLASPGTRLHGSSVHFYDVWRDAHERHRGVAYLAVVVKNNILLYHTPKGERAFRFVKVTSMNIL